VELLQPVVLATWQYASVLVTGDVVIAAGTIKYISKGEWFDTDTEAVLIDDYRPNNGPNSGLFRGYRNGQIDEEVCSFDEFVAMVIE
jgi:hypothetical protein